MYECPVCGSDRLGGIGSGTVHCYACQSTLDESELDEEDRDHDGD